MPHPPTQKKSAEKTHLVTGGSICLMLEQFEQQQQVYPDTRFGAWQFVKAQIMQILRSHF
jgi:hypothetical protein